MMRLSRPGLVAMALAGVSLVAVEALGGKGAATVATERPAPTWADPFVTLRQAGGTRVVVADNRGWGTRSAVLLEGASLRALLAPARARRTPPVSACGRFIAARSLRDSVLAGYFDWDDECTELATDDGLFFLDGELKRRLLRVTQALSAPDADYVVTATCPFARHVDSCSWLPKGPWWCLPDEHPERRLASMTVERTWTLGPTSGSRAGRREQEMELEKNAEQSMRVLVQALCNGTRCAAAESDWARTEFAKGDFNVSYRGVLRWKTAEARDQAQSVARASGFAVEKTDDPESQWEVFVRRGDLPAFRQALMTAPCSTPAE